MARKCKYIQRLGGYRLHLPNPIDSSFDSIGKENAIRIIEGVLPRPYRGDFSDVKEDVQNSSFHLLEKNSNGDVARLTCKFVPSGRKYRYNRMEVTGDFYRNTVSLDITSPFSFKTHYKTTEEHIIERILNRLIGSKNHGPNIMLDIDELSSHVGRGVVLDLHNPSQKRRRELMPHATLLFNWLAESNTEEYLCKAVAHYQAAEVWNQRKNALVAGSRKKPDVSYFEEMESLEFKRAEEYVTFLQSQVPGSATTLGKRLLNPKPKEKDKGKKPKKKTSFVTKRTKSK
tara:strand:- start:491 stop:1351 length:861 start_codon:yes stop_codon:yes gene_type:complete